MKTRRSWFAWLLLLLVTCGNSQGNEPQKSTWRQWRGPLGTGAAPNADPPIEFSETKNVRWKTPLLGRGHSSPVIFGDRIFLTAAAPIGDKIAKPFFSKRPGAHDNLPVTHRQQYFAMAIDRKTGKLLWRTKLNEMLPEEGAHYTGSLASASPIVDDKHLIAFFGSAGLYCLSHTGELIWKAELGKMKSKHGHGEGSTPALFENTLIVNWDHEGDSFIVAFNKTTGKEIWRSARDEVTSWATPIIVNIEGSTQVIVSGSDHVRGYDLKNGKTIWECGGLAQNIVASPVYENGMVFVGSSYEKRVLIAIRLKGAKGDITETEHVAWRKIRGTPYVPSPLLVGGKLYYLAHYQGVLTGVDAKTGEESPGAVRLDGIGNIYASPVAAAGRIYVTDLNGATIVLDQKNDLKILATNQLNDSFSASAAIVENEIYLRGDHYLYCIGDEE